MVGAKVASSWRTSTNCSQGGDGNSGFGFELFTGTKEDASAKQTMEATTRRKDCDKGKKSK